MPLAQWALIQEVFEPLSNFPTPLLRTNQDHSWLDVCKLFGGHSDLMKLLLEICWIALKPFGSHSYLLGPVERLFLLCESWHCVWVWKFVINVLKCFCVLTCASLTELVLSSSFSWARIYFTLFLFKLNWRDYSRLYLFTGKFEISRISAELSRERK